MDRGPRTLVLGNGAPGRMFDACGEGFSVTETGDIDRVAERAPRSTIQPLPATSPEPGAEVRGPRSVEKTAGARAAIGEVRSELMAFFRLALSEPSRTVEFLSFNQRF